MQEDVSGICRMIMSINFTFSLVCKEEIWI